MVHYDFIEIGCSDFDCLILEQDAINKVGLSIEPLQIYLDRLPNIDSIKKLPYAISDNSGEDYIYYVHPDDVNNPENNFSYSLRGCNSIGKVHPEAWEYLRSIKKEFLIQRQKIRVISFEDLILQYEVESIKFLKVDTEGHDCIILNNLLDYIEKNNNITLLPQKIVFEVNKLTTKADQNFVLNRLFKYNYKIIDRNDLDITLEKVEIRENNTTLVTSIYDLKSKDKTNRKPIEEYLERGKFVLDLDQNLVIFTEYKLFWKIWNARKQFISKTIIIIQEFKDINYSQYLPLVTSLKEMNSFKNESKDKDTARFTILMYNKFGFLQEILKNNPFNSEYFAWIDFGISYRCKTIDLSNILNSKISEIQIPIFVNLNEDNIDYKLSKRLIDAGFFIGSYDNMINFNNLFKNELHKVLLNKMAPLEDAIMAKVIFENPDLFHYSFGHHDSVFINWFYSKLYIDSIFQNVVIPARYSQKGMFYANVFCKQLLDGWKKGEVILNPKQIFMLFEEYYIISYYADNTNAKKIALECKKYIEQNSYLFKYIDKNDIDRLKSNLKFVDVILDFSVNDNKLKDISLNLEITDLQIIEFVKPYTLVGKERLLQLLDAIEYVVKNNIIGDFIEIGVYKGGCIMAMILKLIQLGEKRNIHLYDTFSGMTPPDDVDIDLNNIAAKDQFEGVKCYSSLEETKHNISLINILVGFYDDSLIKYHIGDILKTNISNIPDKIAILRLDTDWYESTKFELEHFDCNCNGITIVDDYGHWKGCKRATDEYIEKNDITINKIDYSGIWWLAN